LAPAKPVDYPSVTPSHYEDHHTSSVPMASQLTSHDRGEVNASSVSPTAIPVAHQALTRDEFPSSFINQAPLETPKASLLPEHMKHLIELTEAPRPQESMAQERMNDHGLASMPAQTSNIPMMPISSVDYGTAIQAVPQPFSSIDPYASLSPSVAETSRQADLSPSASSAPVLPLSAPQTWPVAPQMQMAQPSLTVAQAPLMSERERQLRAELEKLEAERLGYLTPVKPISQVELDWQAHEAARLETQRHDFLRQEALRQEALRQEALRQEALRQEAERQEALRLEAQKLELMRQEELRQEALRLEAIRQEEWQRARLEAIEAERVRALQEQLRKEAEDRLAWEASAREAAAKEAAAKEAAARETHERYMREQEENQRFMREQEERLRLQREHEENLLQQKAADEAERLRREDEAQKRAELAPLNTPIAVAAGSIVSIPHAQPEMNSNPQPIQDADQEAQRKADAAAALMRFYSPYAQPAPLKKAIEAPIPNNQVPLPNPASEDPVAQASKARDHGPYTNGVWVNAPSEGTKPTNPFDQGAISATESKSEIAPVLDQLAARSIPQDTIKEVETPNHPSIEVRLINPYGGAPVIMGNDGELDFTQNFGSPSNLPPPVVKAVAPYRPVPVIKSDREISQDAVIGLTQTQNSLTQMVIEPEQPSLVLNRPQKPSSSAELNARISPEGVIMDDGSWWKTILDTLQWILLATIGVACVGGGVAAFLKSREADANFGMQDLFVYIAQGMAVVGLFVIGLSIYFIIKRMNRLPRA
jgi:hypothetical protein